jgi:ABC-2 type transport system ATP-binding protein
MTATTQTSALVAHQLRKSFVRDSGETVAALDGVSLAVEHGALTALVGPDGAGKTTLIRLAAGLMVADGGTLEVLGIDVKGDPQNVQNRISYMPQRFGLYEDLTVQENLDLYADLHGVALQERRQRYARLMEMTQLRPFTQRLAGRLSGGMKQKLGLACTLVRSPELLLLDEPTVGVDPLSRRELWEIIQQLVAERGLTVLVSTSYLDEADRCGRVVVLHEGSVLAEGAPADVSSLARERVFVAQPGDGTAARALQARLIESLEVVDAVPEGGKVRFVVRQIETGPRPALEQALLAGTELKAAAPRFEDGFMILLDRARTKPQGERREAGAAPPPLPPSRVSSSPPDQEPVVVVRDLVRKFGSFTAVDQVTFEVRRGEIFGLLGPNGAGKTTTFRMLCGLLAATSGVLRVAGADLRHARASARQRIGYVAQKFSLYGHLSVGENLAFFASAYGLGGRRKQERVQAALEEFELGSFLDLPSGHLPGGYKQRLAMAAALLHQPETLFLDEPTSGADPMARRDFWRRIVGLAESGVTVIVTTHFMEEAEYCDRLAILDAGRVLAQGTPAEIRRHARAEDRDADMEDAFIAIIEAARAAAVPNGEAAA